MPVSAAYEPARSHESLGPEFYDRVAAAAFPKRVLRFRNQEWARRVGLDTLTDAEWVDHFASFTPLPGSLEAPLALRYHGHQFRSYNPDLGDGRGFLFAQLRDDRGRLLDLGTKGSGQTPWSRAGDGRLTLKGGVREVLATEMLAALGVETSKSFSLVETGEQLLRGDEPSPTRSGVLVRLNWSHIRIGTFQRLMFLQDKANLERLLDYAIATYSPEVSGADTGEHAVSFLRHVTHRVARTGAQWTAAGFVHGVLNTDNINITGESFDYGPWRFLPTLDLGFTAAYFDTNGLYAYGRQPQALLWNLVRLAECLTPFASPEDLQAALGAFEPAFEAAFRTALLRRLGLRPLDEGAETALPQALWSFLEASKAPFDRVFFDWYGGMSSAERAAESPWSPLYQSEAFGPVRAAFEKLAPENPRRLDHSYFKKDEPCGMLIDEVEAIWSPIAERDDWSNFDAKIKLIREMRDATGMTDQST